MVKDEIKKRIAGNILQFTREEIIYWLTQQVFVSDYILQEHGNLIRENADIAVQVIRNMTIDEIRGELVKRRPSENDLWRSEYFDYKIMAEFQRIMAFIQYGY
jgi:hypothetical protein